MGRTAKPTNLKIVTGNPGKRGFNKQEPDPEYLSDLTPPAFLSESAKIVWNEIAQNLRNARLLSKVDVPILAMLCESISAYRKANKQCSDNPLVHSENTGGDVLSQWKIVEAMSLKQVLALAKEFGMTPAARTRISIQPQLSLFGDEPGQSYLT